jgi:hypothetical protein
MDKRLPLLRERKRLVTETKMLKAVLYLVLSKKDGIILRLPLVSAKAG